MKLIIAGGRDYQLTYKDESDLDALKFMLGITEVVSGGATGADAGGERWAETVGLPVKPFPVSKAEWRELGRKAGPLRNARMAEYADAVVLFPGADGTESMYQEAKKRGLKIFDWRLP